MPAPQQPKANSLNLAFPQVLKSNLGRAPEVIDLIVKQGWNRLPPDFQAKYVLKAAKTAKSAPPPPGSGARAGPAPVPPPARAPLAAKPEPARAAAPKPEPARVPARVAPPLPAVAKPEPGGVVARAALPLPGPSAWGGLGAAASMVGSALSGLVPAAKNIQDMLKEGILEQLQRAAVKPAPVAAPPAAPAPVARPAPRPAYNPALLTDLLAATRECQRLGRAKKQRLCSQAELTAAKRRLAVAQNVRPVPYPWEPAGLRGL